MYVVAGKTTATQKYKYMPLGDCVNQFGSFLQSGTKIEVGLGTVLCLHAHPNTKYLSLIGGFEPRLNI